MNNFFFALVGLLVGFTLFLFFDGFLRVGAAPMWGCEEAVPAWECKGACNSYHDQPAKRGVHV